MAEQILLDTPINRASIAQMPIADVEKFVEGLQFRRLQSYNIYQAGLEAKARAKHDKDAVQLEKALDQLLKALEAATKALDKAQKKATDVQALRLALGETL